MSIKLSHVNFKGHRNISGYSAAHWDTKQGHSIELLESGVIMISKPGEKATFVGSGAWDGAEALEAAAAGPVKLQDSLEASKQAVPEPTHLDSSGEAQKQSYNVEQRANRKTRKN